MRFLTTNTHRKTIGIAVLLLGIMAVLAYTSMWRASLTFDELAHIPAGYSYLTLRDYRINPEHPPLVKDIPAIPLLFLDLNFPSDSPQWQQEESPYGPPPWWVQFDLGRMFLYESGNNPRVIILASRSAMIGMLLLLGWFMFRWTKKLWGNKAALLVLTFFAFSPTFLAHGRLVNTDVGAVVGIAVASCYWFQFLRAPSWKNIIKAGLALGCALLFKFSLILLVPFFAVITIIYAALSAQNRLRQIGTYSVKALAAGAIAVFLLWPIYQFHIWEYPVEHQLRDTTADFEPDAHMLDPFKAATLWMTEKPLLRPWAQYMRGLVMATQRSALGNTTYFLGEMRDGPWIHYFPVMYATKVPLAFHVLTAIAIAIGLWYGIRRCMLKNKTTSRIQTCRQLLVTHFELVAMALFIVLYWDTSLRANLNIGVRHLMPIFPFMYILVSFGIARILRTPSPGMSRLALRNTAAGIISVLLFWYILSSSLSFPHYIPYYNELVGGTERGYTVAVDSNYDWGQDFYRLMAFMDEHHIEHIHLDYFGGESPAYWLGERHERYNPKEDDPPTGWLAVSVNELMGGTGRPGPGYTQRTGYYDWLLDDYFVTRAGKSIFIYHIPE